MRETGPYLRHDFTADVDALIGSGLDARIGRPHPQKVEDPVADGRIESGSVVICVGLVECVLAKVGSVLSSLPFFCGFGPLMPNGYH